MATCTGRFDVVILQGRALLYDRTDAIDTVPAVSFERRWANNVLGAAILGLLGTQREQVRVVLEAGDRCEKAAQARGSARCRQGYVAIQYIACVLIEVLGGPSTLFREPMRRLDSELKILEEQAPHRWRELIGSQRVTR